ncbi:type I-E CRISPR-associated protein Cas6/Cse3/CasE [Cutibacterium sp. WCA-380-WT-3A]|uniref:Type I-E CRISPR-associated protein Cas6/Cse3/CasE n=1 Tax=Cutibacterium porci TaxID=2605781 RepID=A0A7K0J5X3_9ACTN|nr:type I-E CRISPR-associated protein Cas6/Cse3/CasE [Cutibacterium porci]MSS45313.1 type I-E CRISPR-associated protein Cas6/Cse3/CasE [Cutibacterium porci]
MLTSIDLTRPAAAAALRNVRWLHHRIDGTFSGGRILWAQRTPMHILVRHDAYRPNADMSWIASAGVIAEGHPSDGDTIQLHLVACPCASVRTPGRSRGVRTPITDHDGQITWARQRFRDIIDCAAVDATPLRPVFGHKSSGLVTIRRVDYTVSGRVIDAAALERMVASGVGPGKAYGCGMVMVTHE